MKQLKKSIRAPLIVAAACGLLLSMAACDSFLAKNTDDVLAPKSFYKTPGDLEAGVTSAWASVLRGRQTSFAGATFINPLMGGDDWTTEPDRAVPASTDRLSATPTSKFIKRNWSKSYQAIFRVNTMLAHLDESPVAEAAKNEAAAQVRFLRGWLYFRLVRLFGDVPLMTAPEHVPDTSRTPVAEVYGQIVQDLTFAEEHLPLEWSGAPGKPTKWAAKAMLGRVYLTMAGWPLHDEAKYAAARDKYKEVIDAGSFRLLDDFADLWQIENRWNDEYVFALPFCASCNSGVGNALTGSTTAPLEEGGTGAGLAEIGFFEDFPAGPRKDATYYTVFNDGTHWKDGQLGHPYFAKWRSGTSFAGDGSGATFSDRSSPLIRYAHVLLGFAEAQAMADGAPSGAAYDAVNEVRRRAGLSDLPSGLSQIAFRDSVIQERGWEFAGEFSRWFDLVRTEKVAEANANKAEGDMKPLRNLSAAPKEDYYWLPIPETELSKSPNMTQNPGY